MAMRYLPIRMPKTRAETQRAMSFLDEQLKIASALPKGVERSKSYLNIINASKEILKHLHKQDIDEQTILLFTNWMKHRGFL